MKLIERVRSLRQSNSKDSRKIMVDEKDVKMVVENNEKMVDEKDVKIITKKSSSSASTIRTKKSSSSASIAKNPTIGSSSSASASEEKKIEIINFTVSIEALDGIIATNTGGRHANIGQLGVPVFGVVAYHQTVSGSKNIVKTNIPSMPLVKSNSSFGNRDRFQAGFGFPDEGKGNTLEQIKIALPMRKSKFSSSGYVERQLDLSFSLMRGSEVMKMGVVSVVLGGNECGESKLAQICQEKTVRTTHMKGNKRISRKTKTTVGARSASFIQDPSRRYSLQRANLRVSVEAYHRASKISSTSAYVLGSGQRQVPVTELISIEQSDSVSMMTGMEMKSSYSTEDSLLIKNSKMAMSLSEDNSLLDEDYFKSMDGEDSFAESDYGTVNADMNVPNVPPKREVSDDDSTREGGSTIGDESTIGDDSMMFLDNVSLGTIEKFAEIGNKMSASVDEREVSKGLGRSSSSRSSSGRRRRIKSKQSDYEL